MHVVRGNCVTIPTYRWLRGETLVINIYHTFLILDLASDQHSTISLVSFFRCVFRLLSTQPARYHGSLSGRIRDEIWIPCGKPESKTGILGPHNTYPACSSLFPCGTLALIASLAGWVGVAHLCKKISETDRKIFKIFILVPWKLLTKREDLPLKTNEDQRDSDFILLSFHGRNKNMCEGLRE